MSVKNAIAKKQDKLMLFVTGIPSKTSPEQVLTHFRQFGAVELHKLGTSKKNNKVLTVDASANTRRGFCILHAGDLQAYNAIISSSNVRFQGRTLAISKFRQGSELTQHNEYLNARRVIVKKVPAGICPDAFKLQLQAAFGVITRMYKYEAESIEKAAKKEKKRKTNTYSVEFEEVVNAEKAASASLFYLQGVSKPILVERYQRKSATSDSSQYANITKPLKKDSYDHTKDYTKSQQRIANLPTADGVSPVSFDEPSKPNSQVHGRYQESVIDHCTKPTTRLYFTSRPQFQQIESGITPFQDILRFNVKEKTPLAAGRPPTRTAAIITVRILGNKPSYSLF